MLIALAASALSLSGCVTPLIVDNEFAGIGGFSTERISLSPGVNYHKNVGLGLYMSKNGVGIGWVDQRYIIFEESVEGVHLLTPLGEIATGKKAERLARFGGMLIPVAQSAGHEDTLSSREEEDDDRGKYALDEETNQSDRIVLVAGDELARSLR